MICFGDDLVGWYDFDVDINHKYVDVGDDIDDGNVDDGSEGAADEDDGDNDDEEEEKDDSSGKFPGLPEKSRQVVSLPHSNVAGHGLAPTVTSAAVNGDGDDDNDDDIDDDNDFHYSDVDGRVGSPPPLR